MQKMNPQCCRIETLISSLLFLMTIYRREGRQEVALSIANHLECLGQHPEADESVRLVATGICDEWRRIQGARRPAALH